MQTTVAPPRTGVPLDALFRPRAIAILGASGRSSNPFARPLQFLQDLGYEGGIHPVNPNYETLRGLPCYPSLDALPEPVDLVLMLVSAAEVTRQLPAVAAAGATAGVVFASGFAETGPDGAARQATMVATARDHGIRLLGPNCQGIVAVHDRTAATFTAALDRGLPRPGNVAYVGQSGAIGGSVLSLARERGLGIGAWASTGNQADLSALDVGEYLVEDDRLDVLSLYLESPVDGAQYARLAGRVADLGKTLLVLRSARSAAGARAAASHTGAIIGPDAAFGALSREYGVVEADDLEDFVVSAQALSVLPRAAGRRMAIVTTSGGAGSLAADQAEGAGLVVEPLTAGTQELLAAVVPEFGAVTNPVDVTAQLFRGDDVSDFMRVCRHVLADPGTDALLVALTMVTGEIATRMACGLAEVWADASKPMLVVWLAAREQTEEARAVLRERGFPLVDSPALACRVLRMQVRPERRNPVPPPDLSTGVIAALPVGGDTSVTEVGGAELLDALGVDRPVQRLVTSVEAADEAAAAIGGPVVLKIQSPGLLHKTERGGVRVGVAATDAGRVYRDLVGAFDGEEVLGVLVAAMAPPGPELVIGLTNTEPGFPPLLTVGIGGVATELYGDVATALAPVSEAEAEAMIRGLRAAPLITGHRGAPGSDLTAATRAIAQISRLGTALGDRLVELEINPLRLVDGGATALALDFLLQLDSEGPTS